MSPRVFYLRYSAAGCSRGFFTCGIWPPRSAGRKTCTYGGMHGRRWRARGLPDVAAGFLPAVLAQGGVQVGKPAPTVECTGCGERAGLALRAGRRKSAPSRRPLARDSLCVLRLAKPIQEYLTRSASNPKKEPDTFANLVKYFAEMAKVFRNSCETFHRNGETC